VINAGKYQQSSPQTNAKDLTSAKPGLTQFEAIFNPIGGGYTNRAPGYFLMLNRGM
jgi:hypothetical protein